MKEANKDKIALFDMDGVLCDYEGMLIKDLTSLKSPYEKSIKKVFGKGVPKYLKNRMSLVKSKTDWWINLPKYKLGWDILEIAKKIGFRVIILSKNPGHNPEALTGKKKWIEKNMGENTEVILTADKGLVYGRVLVDDYPEFLKQWLKHRPNGVAIMPVNQNNKYFTHPQVIRYNGKNLKQVKEALKIAFSRITH